MSRSPCSASASRPGGSLAAQPSQVPQCQQHGAAPRPPLTPATAPTFTLPRPPAPHCRPPRSQYNGMSLPGALRRPARPPPADPESGLVPQIPSSAWNLNFAKSGSPASRGDCAPPLPPNLPFSAPDPTRPAPGVNPAPWAPPPSPDHPPGVVHPLPCKR